MLVAAPCHSQCPPVRWRHAPLLIVACVWAGFATVAEARDQSQSPNVVVILADDQGWGDLSVHGNRNLATPAIDTLARDGAIFDRFYVCPVCSPTRAEFLTGRYHPRGGVFDVSTGGERLDLDERTIADVFRAAGYATGIFGKWHNGSQYPFHPLGRGFQEFYGYTSGHWGDYFSPPLEQNGNIVRGNGFLADDVTDHALDFIRQHREQPFLCYLPLPTPHSPMQVPDRFFERFATASLQDRGQEQTEEDLNFTRAALAMCENIDENVGRVLETLIELQLDERTIVLYFSDNGPNSARWNGGMKGRKGSTDEGGVRSPLLIRWPGTIPAGNQVKQLAAAIDLLPTLADLTKVPLPNDRPLDGISLVPWLTRPETSETDRQIFSHWAGKVSVRTARYRFDHQGGLFDMIEDPRQSRNIASAQPDMARQLRAAVDEWKMTVLAEMKREARPYPVGAIEFPWTPLPARDGEPHGQVRRSAKAPNCSYFTDWTSPDDRITWDVEVLHPGRYEVVIEYACPAADVGSEIEIALGAHTLTAAVTMPHDPPAYGAEHDRVDRKGESLMKDFRPWRVGILDLPAGRGTLTLRAITVPHGRVMEVGGLQLTRLP